MVYIAHIAQIHFFKVGLTKPLASGLFYFVCVFEPYSKPPIVISKKNTKKVIDKIALDVYAYLADRNANHLVSTCVV